MDGWMDGWMDGRMDGWMWPGLDRGDIDVNRILLLLSIPPAVRPSRLRQMDMGSLTRAQIWVRAVHTKGAGQAQTSLHKSGLGGT